MDELRWFIEFERAKDDFTRDGDEHEFRLALRRLGFTCAEASDVVDEETA